MKNRFILFFATLTLLSACNEKEEQVKQPNIILILADDLGSGDVNCYNPSSRIPTPNMDLIAEQGVRFTDAHTGSAVCTPTRYGIMTGRYCWRTRLTRGVLNGYSDHLIDPARTTIASMLKARGYYTAGIGKWHLGMDYKKDSLGEVDFSAKIENSPNVNGFDYFYGIAASLDFPPYVYIENDHFTKIPTETQEKLMFPRYLRKGEKADDFHFETAWEHLMEKASGIIEKHPINKPFFLYFALPSPHKPVWPDSRFIGETELGPYGDFVYQTDQIVGVILQKLKKSGIEENTLLMVTSDNGSFMYRLDDANEADHLGDETIQGYFPENHTANYIFRGTKADVWEAGHRVPFLVQWPGNIEEGKVLDQTICTTDFLATLADLLGVDLAENEGEDSFSFMSLLWGNEEAYTREPVVNHSSNGMFAIRDGAFKLVLGNGSGGRQHPRGTPWEKPYALFNLDKDISETLNIIDENQSLALKMEQNMIRIIESGSSKEKVQKIAKSD